MMYLPIKKNDVLGGRAQNSAAGARCTKYMARIIPRVAQAVKQRRAKLCRRARQVCSGGLGVAWTVAPAYAVATAGFFVMGKFGARPHAIRIRRCPLQRLPSSVRRIGGMRTAAARRGAAS